MPQELAEISYNLATGQYGHDEDTPYAAKADLVYIDAATRWHTVVEELSTDTDPFQFPYVTVLKTQEGAPHPMEDTTPPLVSLDGPVANAIFWGEDISRQEPEPLPPIGCLKGLLDTRLQVLPVDCLPQLDVWEPTHVVATRFRQPETDVFLGIGGQIEEHGVSYLALLPGMVLEQVEETTPTPTA